jgi:hypothetical protein
LHDISPIVARLCVSSAVRAPMRAAPAAADHNNVILCRDVIHGGAM